MLKEIVILPELLLVLISMISLLCSVIYNNTRRIAFMMIGATLTVLLSIASLPSTHLLLFYSTFLSDTNTIIAKIIILIGTLGTMILHTSITKIDNVQPKIELLSLMILAVAGAFIAVSARDFLLLFCALELQALACYAMAAMGNGNKVAEGAVKYFILGALMSCISLFGISLIYGFTGSLKFNVLYEIVNSDVRPNIAVIIGIVLFLANIFFKLSVAPLHAWTPDVYEGSDVVVTTYFATVQKIANFIVLLSILIFAIGNYKQISVDLIRIVAILSMLIGVFGAIRQHSLKRLMAYGTILNIGYCLIGVTLHNPEGFLSAIIYLITYVCATMGFFACLIALLGKRADIVTFDDIAGIAHERKTIALVLSLLCFSMIGLPPLAGFFGKYSLFYNAILHNEWLLVVVGLSASIVASFYYLKIVKYMYFMDNLSGVQKINTDKGLLLVSVFVVIFILFYSIM